MAMTPERLEECRELSKRLANEKLYCSARVVEDLIAEVERLQAIVAAESHSPESIEEATQRALKHIRASRTKGHGGRKERA